MPPAGSVAEADRGLVLGPKALGQLQAMAVAKMARRRSSEHPARTDPLLLVEGIHKDIGSIYRRNWHHTKWGRLLLRVLAAVYPPLRDLGYDPIYRLLLTGPPQHGKSELVTRVLPAMALGLVPDLSVGIGCYSAELAKTFGPQIKRYMRTDFYRTVYPEVRVPNKGYGGDRKSKDDFFELLDQRGSCRLAGVGGPLTGMPITFGVLDDLIKDDADARSPAVRRKTWTWLSRVFMTRIHEGAPIVFITTRWHEDDPAGRLLRRQGHLWTHVNIEALAEVDYESDPDDPRSYGEALWPERKSKETLEAERDLDPRGFSALYQGRPSAEGGNIIQRSWVRRYEAPEALATFQAGDRTIIVADLADDGKEESDPTSFQVWTKTGSRYRMIDRVHGLLAFPAQISTARALRKRWEAEIHVENKSNGKALKSWLETAPESDEEALDRVLLWPEKGTSFVNAPKAVRLGATAPLWKAGNVELPDTIQGDEVEEEVVNFPSWPTDDDADAASMALIELAGLSMGKKEDPEGEAVEGWLAAYGQT